MAGKKSDGKDGGNKDVDESHTFEDMANGRDFYSILYSPLSNDHVERVNCVYTPGMEVVNGFIARVESRKRIKQGKVATSFISAAEKDIYKLMLSSDIDLDNYNRMMGLAYLSPNSFVRNTIANNKFTIFHGSYITVRIEKDAFYYLDAWAEKIGINKSSAIALAYWIDFNILASENQGYRDVIDASEFVRHDVNVARQFLMQFIDFNAVLTCLERNGFLYDKKIQ